MTRRLKSALKESLIDTGIAMPVNLIINWIVITTAFHQQWTAFATTIIATALFTAMAIVRKTYIRLHFEKKHGA